MITVWGRADSSNVQAVMWCLAELDLSVQRHDVGHRFGGTDAPDFIEMNPNRTVPVLRDGDGPALWETGAILRYLGARYGDEVFWPKDLDARTEVDRWAEWAKINVALAFTGPVFWRVVRTKAADRDWTAIRKAVETLEETLEIAEARLAHRSYLVGDALSLSDIQFGHVLYRYFDIAIERRNLPAIAAYFDRLTARPAYRDNVMVSYDALRSDQDVRAI
ncbi:glutathione S-transferase family protein [Thalassococcus sp. S3]|uniref:glutathione S-transferase family protein n=1 Tax=Thalassococcus sp. S3 TaxID=2017482 RepID=UPI0010244321|nr:glutathione S-transferase family protein [Thalassococcus sp. S3]QBF30952.1 glutathione S-transferase [Thalassococcus sp. S3]